MGFSVYAAETLSESVTTRTVPYPSLRDGYYSREPIFGALLRHVRELEYSLVAYEHIPPGEGLTSEQIAVQREQGQAENLRERIFAATPSARVLVHAGYGHVYERGGVPGVGPMMTQRLKDITGIDPLTIDQTAYVSPTDDFVVCDRPDRNYVDIEIGAPVTIFEASRPAWRYRAGQRPVPVPSALAPTRTGHHRGPSNG